MAEPDPKDPAIDALLRAAAGRDRVASIRADICILCGKAATDFTDALSRREYSISGLCQACQDIAFAEDQ